MKPRPALLAFCDYISGYNSSSVPDSADTEAKGQIQPLMDLVAPGHILHVVQGVNVFFKAESKGFRHVHEVLLYHDIHEGKPVWLGMKYDDERTVPESNKCVVKTADTPADILALVDGVVGRALSKSRDYHWHDQKGDIYPVLSIHQVHPRTHAHQDIDTAQFLAVPVIGDTLAAHKPLLLLAMAAYMNSPAGIANAFRLGVADPNAALVLPSGTAVAIAAAQGNLEALSVLLERPEIDPNGRPKDSQNRSALFHALEADQMSAFDLLLQSPKTNPNADDIWGRTPLTAAIHTGRTEFAKRLIAHPATDINKPDRLYDMPPFIYAVGRQNLSVVGALMARDDLELSPKLDDDFPDMKVITDRYRQHRRNRNAGISPKNTI